jgi:hypothetical protein
LIATVRPPIGLPEPGLTFTEVTPPARASSKPFSSGLIAVERAGAGHHRVGRLVGVVAGPALALLVDAQVHVRVDEAGQHPGALGVQHRVPLRDPRPGPQRRDVPIGHDDGPLERFAVMGTMWAPVIATFMPHRL